MNMNFLDSVSRGETEISRRLFRLAPLKVSGKLDLPVAVRIGRKEPPFSMFHFVISGLAADGCEW